MKVIHPTPSGNGKRYGMTIDVNRCVGCQTCTIACKHANDTTPGIQWRKVVDVEQGSFPDVERFFLVTGCQHCAEPPCVPVCPSGATFQRDDGLVVMDYNLCIGCASCAVACPYQARTLAHEIQGYYGEQTIQEKASAHPERRGVAQKCTFCIEKIDEAHEFGLTPGVDLDVTPACAASCISQAIKFGDFNDPESEVSQLARERGHFRINDSLGTDPQIKYLYEVPNAIPGKAAEAPSDEELRDPNNPLAGQLQTFWDYRAAMNFIMGGIGSGFAIIAALLALAGLLPLEQMPGAAPVAGIIVAVGLFFVFLKIGRQFRALNVLMRPQTSWMSREVYAVALLFPLLALAWFRPSLAGMAGLAVAAAAFLLCQARILYASKGIPAWRAPLVPALLIATGLSEGSGVTAVLTGLAGPGRATTVPAAVLAVTTLATLALWHRYRTTARANGLPPQARDVLDALSPKYMGALALGIVAMLVGTGLAQPLICAAAGVVVVVAGAAMKLALITRASYQQGFVLPTVPRRGGGRCAAPPRLEGLAKG